MDSISRFLDEFRTARKISKLRVCDVVVDSHDDLRHAVSNMAQAATLRKSQDNMPILAKVKQVIRDTGDVAEGCLLPFLKFRAALTEIISGGTKSYSEIRKGSFGSLLQDLDSLSQLKNIHDLGIPLSVSQLRNVCQHNSYSVMGDFVNLKYGNNLQHSFSIKLHDLEIVAYRLSKLFLIYKTTVTLFILDYSIEFAGKLSYNPQNAEYTHLSILAQDLILNKLLIDKFIIEGERIDMKLVYIGNESLTERDIRNLLEKSIYRYFLNYVIRDFKVKVKCGLRKYKYEFRVMTPTAYRLLP